MRCEKGQERVRKKADSNSGQLCQAVCAIQFTTKELLEPELLFDKPSFVMLSSSTTRWWAELM